MNTSENGVTGMDKLPRLPSEGKGGRLGEAQLPVHLGEAQFGAEVLQSKKPVLVAFSAPWSRACQVLDAVLPELASALDGKVKVVKVNADNSLDLSICYDIQSVPTLLYFAEGTPRLRIVGTATREAVLAKLKPLGVTNEDSGGGNGTCGAGRTDTGGQPLGTRASDREDTASEAASTCAPEIRPKRLGRKEK